MLRRSATRHSKFSLTPAQTAHVSQIASSFPANRAHDFRLALARILTVSAVDFVTNELLELAIEAALAEVGA